MKLRASARFFSAHSGSYPTTVLRTSGGIPQPGGSMAPPVSPSPSTQDGDKALAGWVSAAGPADIRVVKGWLVAIDDQVLLIKLVVEEYINHISPYWMRLLASTTAAYADGWNHESGFPVEFYLLYRWHSLAPATSTWGGAPWVALRQSDASRIWSPPLAGAESKPVPGGSDCSTQRRCWTWWRWASIQQGRDNRLARYNDYRALFAHPRVTRFEQINSDPLVVSELRRIYSDAHIIYEFCRAICRRRRRARLCRR